MVALEKCEKCGVANETLVRISTGETDDSGEEIIAKICTGCNNKRMHPEMIEISLPEDIVFTSKFAKMGNKRNIIEIPSKLKKLLDLDAEYIVLLRKLT